MDKVKLFFRGLAALLIANAVAAILAQTLTALLPDSMRWLTAVLAGAALVITAMFLYPLVTGAHRDTNDHSAK
jgi:hypothetical protein